MIEGTWVSIQSQHLAKVKFFFLQVVLGVGEGSCSVVQASDQIPLDVGVHVAGGTGSPGSHLTHQILPLHL